MEKVRKILLQAKTNLAASQKIVSDSGATIAEAQENMNKKQNKPQEKKKESAGASRKNAKSKTSGQQSQTKFNPNQMEFPVIGIGASAGGLEAMQVFFEHITAPLDAAIVIVQHLSPDHDSFMEELLSRYTSIPVDFIKDGMPVMKNHIYLIPPKVNILIKGGILHHQPIEGRGLNLPIDIFFRTLAEDQQSNAVAVILSGAGSDGTLGIRAIKEFGGITMVQDPHDAKFDGMPKSALSTDMVDLVRPVADLADELVSYLEHPLFAHPCNTLRLESENQTQYNHIISILKATRKIDFASYRRETIARRLEKRISINRFVNLADYVDYLRKNPQEVDILFHEILIGVTRFFRDPEAFATLDKMCFEPMFKNMTNEELRIWVASCSTGEEAYSIAILVKEYMLKHRIVADVKIFATDIDDKSLKFAANGFYPQNVVSDIPTQYLAKYFSPRGNGYQINPDIRRMIIFASQDLIENPPFFKLDLVTCRNFLIYICPEAQQRVLSSFYVGLKDGGFLFLGPSESLAELSMGFDTLSSREKIFRKHEGFTPQYIPKSPMPLHLSLLEHPESEFDNSLSQENRELLAILEQIDEAFLSPSLVVDSNNNIIYTIRNAGKMIQQASGRVTTNLLKILPHDLSLIVSSLIRRAEGRPGIISSEIVLDGRPMIVRCKFIVTEKSNAKYYYLCFDEPAGNKTKISKPLAGSADLSNRYHERIEELESEVRQQKESLKIAVEQLETSNEELQASNEELVASNEELQSSNEELQSVNEELYTVNIEHVRKLEEITELNYDYDNLLSNTQVGTLFLDSRLVIRKISKIAGDITGIIQNDVGRPLSYFSLRKLYPKFFKDVEIVNEKKKMIEKELEFRGKTYCMRIVPYLAEENVYKGIVITFVDLTDCKMRALQEASQSQEQVRTSNEQLEAAAALAKMAHFRINIKTGKCTGGRLLHELWPMRNGCVINPEEWIFPEDLTDVNAKIKQLLNGSLENIVLNFRSEYFGEMRYYRLGASISPGSTGAKYITGVIQNTTKVIQAQLRYNAQNRFWNTSIDAIPVLFYAKDADNDFRYVFANRYFLEFTGKSKDEVIGKTDAEITPSGARFRSEDIKALNDSGDVTFENEVMAHDGSIRYFHTTKCLKPGLDGHRLIVGIGSDVTEQHLSTQDITTANQCMTVLFETNDFNLGLRKAMEILCLRMGASLCFWMSINHVDKTIRCNAECVISGSDKKLLEESGIMPFTGAEEWYKCLNEDKVLDIPDISASEEAMALLGRYSGYPSELEAKSVYSVGIRDNDMIKGAVGFIYTGNRPKFSQERLTYLMSFAANLFKSIFRRYEPSESDK